MEEFFNFCIRVNGGEYNEGNGDNLRGEEFYGKSTDNLSLLSCNEEIASELQND